MEKQEKEKHDFPSLWERYGRLSRGEQAELRKIKEPDDLREHSVLYRLLGSRPDPQMLRIVYFLPYADHKGSAESLGGQLAKAGINEKRLIQIARSEENDLTYLRRILQHVKEKMKKRLVVDWEKFGETLFFWGEKSKRNLLEDFFVAKYAEKSKKQKGKKS